MDQLGENNAAGEAQPLTQDLISLVFDGRGGGRRIEHDAFAHQRASGETPGLPGSISGVTTQTRRACSGQPVSTVSSSTR